MFTHSLNGFPRFKLEEAPDWLRHVGSPAPPIGGSVTTPQSAIIWTATSLTGVSLWNVRHGMALECALPGLCLTEQDFAEFAHIRYAPGRRRSLQARACLREALSAFVGGGVSPLEWNFARDKYGKPHLRQATNLSFNCSHSALVSVVAVATDRSVGVDITGVKPDQDMALIDEFLAPNERQSLGELPVDARQREIARIWSLKEATVKMLGTGFSFDLSRLDFSIEPDCSNSFPGGIAELSEFAASAITIEERSHVYSVAIATGRDLRVEGHG